jgi:hypothetical protein
MRMTLRNLTPLLIATGAATALAAAPAAVADTTTTTDSTLPQCTSVGGVTDMGAGTTECATPGNVQLNATPPAPTYLYPWADEFYGPALIIGGEPGGGGGGSHGGGGR